MNELLYFMKKQGEYVRKKEIIKNHMWNDGLSELKSRCSVKMKNK